VAAVGQGLFSQGLEQAGLQRQQLLRLLGGQHGLGVGIGFRQSGARGGHVQFDELFNAFESLAGQAENGFEVGLLSGQNLFLRQGHEELLIKDIAIIGDGSWNCSDQLMLQCSMDRIIWTFRPIARIICCNATFFVATCFSCHAAKWHGRRCACWQNA